MAWFPIHMLMHVEVTEYCIGQSQTTTTLDGLARMSSHMHSVGGMFQVSRLHPTYFLLQDFHVYGLDSQCVFGFV